MRTIAQDWLDWEKLGPVAEQYRSLIGKEIESDTRKLTSFEAFEKSFAKAPEAGAAPAGGRPGESLRAFADGRRKYLLNYSETKKATP